MELKPLLQETFKVKNIAIYLFLVLIPALIFYFVSILIFKSQGFTYIEILRDSAQQLNESSFLGFVSNIGVFFWVSAASISFFSGFTLLENTNKKQKELLLILGILSLLLAFDDFFMIHDRYINQKICYTIYALCLVIILFRYFRIIVQHNGLSFLLAGLLLGLSILADLLEKHTQFSYEQVQIVEEMFKFTGIVSWLYFIVTISAHLIKKQNKHRVN